MKLKTELLFVNLQIYKELFAGPFFLKVIFPFWEGFFGFKRKSSTGSIFLLDLSKMEYRTQN